MFTTKFHHPRYVPAVLVILNSLSQQLVRFTCSVSYITHYERRKSILCTGCFECGTWSVTVREAYKLRVTENRLLRDIFGSMREGLIEDWRKLRSEEFCTPHQILLG